MELPITELGELNLHYVDVFYVVETDGGSSSKDDSCLFRLQGLFLVELPVSATNTLTHSKIFELYLMASANCIGHFLNNTR